MKAMARQRSHSIEFKRQVAQEFIAGESLYALSKRHDISRQLIRVWLQKYEAGALDEDAQAADLLQEYEAKISARAVGAGRGCGGGASAGCGVIVSSAFEAPAVVAGLDDIAVVGQAVEQCGSHLCVSEYARSFAEGEIRGDDDRGALVEPADVPVSNGECGRRPRHGDCGCNGSNQPRKNNQGKSLPRTLHRR
jgi:hypothetical protein